MKRGEHEKSLGRSQIPNLPVDAHTRSREGLMRVGRMGMGVGVAKVDRDPLQSYSARSGVMSTRPSP